MLLNERTYMQLCCQDEWCRDFIFSPRTIRTPQEIYVVVTNLWTAEEENTKMKKKKEQQQQKLGQNNEKKHEISVSEEFSLFTCDSEKVRPVWRKFLREKTEKGL